MASSTAAAPGKWVMTTLLGRGTHRRRVAAESGNSDLIADRQTLYAQGPGTPERPLVAALDDICT